MYLGHIITTTIVPTVVAICLRLVIFFKRGSVQITEIPNISTSGTNTQNNMKFAQPPCKPLQPKQIIFFSVHTDTYVRTTRRPIPLYLCHQSRNIMALNSTS